jgi:hypothetical protein
LTLKVWWIFSTYNDGFNVLLGATVNHVQRINNIFKLILHKSFFYSAREKRLEVNEVTDRERSGTSTEMREGASEGGESIANKFSLYGTGKHRTMSREFKMLI